MNNTKIQDGETFRALVQRADQGDFIACGRVGRIYDSGDESLGVAADSATASRYYEKGAQGGDLQCMYNLARMMMPDDPARAITLLEACASGKYMWAMATLGDFYLRGRHVQKDNNKAFQYLREYTTLCRPEKVGQNTFKVRWDLVLYPLCLLLGVGCEKDEKTARAVLTELAAQGNLGAIDILRTGQLNDWMAAKRFNFDTKSNGPVALLDVAGSQGYKPPSKSFAGKPRVSKAAREIVDKRELSLFLRRTLNPDETILMHAHFPRIYTVDTVLRFFALVLLGRWMEHVFAVYGGPFLLTLPESLGAWLYQNPQWPLVAFGIFGIFHVMNRMIALLTTEIVLTDSRFVYKHGLFSVKMIQMNFWQIQHSDVTQSILGTMMDYGRVHIESYSIRSGEDPLSKGGALSLPAISHPYLFSRLIEDNRQLPYKRRGTGDVSVEPTPMPGGNL